MKNENKPLTHLATQEKQTERHKVSSRELFGTQHEIIIEHNDNKYLLRITSNDKLILTK